MNLPRTLQASAAAVLCGLLAGCGQDAADGTPEPREPMARGDVVLSADPAADGMEYPAADLTGLLTLNDGCLALDGSPTLWPAGSSWEQEEMTVVLADGSRLKVGDRVEVGGGLVSPTVASNYSATAQKPIEACMRSLGAQELALIRGTLS